jgi:hypothetical protein
MRSLRSLAALSALACVVVLASGQPVRSDAVVLPYHDSYAAIAYSVATGNYGTANNWDTRQGAEEAALANCKADDARIVAWVQNGFCALALGDDKSKWAYGVSYNIGATNVDAMARALAACRAQTTGAYIVVCICSE